MAEWTVSESFDFLQTRSVLAGGAHPRLVVEERLSCCHTYGKTGITVGAGGLPAIHSRQKEKRAEEDKRWGESFYIGQDDVVLPFLHWDFTIRAVYLGTQHILRWVPEKVDTG